MRSRSEQPRPFRCLSGRSSEQPGKPELYLYLANAHLDIEQYKQAAEVLKKGMELAPDRDDLTFTLAIAYEKMGRRDDMVEALTRTLEIKTGQRRRPQLPGLQLCREG